MVDRLLSFVLLLENREGEPWFDMLENRLSSAKGETVAEGDGCNLQ